MSLLPHPISGRFSTGFFLGDLGYAVLSLLVFAYGLGSDTAAVIALARLDKDQITVGDLLQLTLEVTYDEDIVIQMPGPKLGLGKFELREERHGVPVPTPDGRILTRSTYVVTAFSTGDLKVPPIPIKYSYLDGTRSGQVTTQPLTVNVASVLTDEMQDIQDIKPPFEIPLGWLSIILALVTGIALAAVGVLLFRRHRRKLRRQQVLQRPALPPHLAAYRALNRLRESTLLERGEVVPYHVEAADIIRHYFAARFHIDSLEMTSREILHHLLKKEISDPILETTRRFLEQCDLVKFAKLHPPRPRSEKLLELAYDIVDTTQPARIPSPPGGVRDMDSQDIPVPTGGAEELARG